MIKLAFSKSPADHESLNAATSKKEGKENENEK